MHITMLRQTWPFPRYKSTIFSEVGQLRCDVKLAMTHSINEAYVDVYIVNTGISSSHQQLF